MRYRVRLIRFVASVLLGLGLCRQVSAVHAGGRLQARGADSLEIVLLFDGSPLLSKKLADSSCYGYAQKEWINCQIRPAGGMQR